jgi:formylglycine-generating enzyme required for sulfatase activity
VRAGRREVIVVADVEKTAQQLLATPGLPLNFHRDAALTLDRLGDPRPGVGTKDGSPDIVFVKVPAGTREVGTSEAERAKIAAHAWADGWMFTREVPSHSITLPEFAISRFPVTVAQFAAFEADPQGYSNGDWWTDPSAGPTNAPVVEVSWYEANAFCRWFSHIAGSTVALPTEVEWEAAARPVGQIFSWGDDFDDSRCNSKASGVGGVLPVGCYDLGEEIQDLCGNVWEWCSSAATLPSGVDAPYPYVYSADREAEELGGARYRIVRGGSFVNPAFLLRAAYRGRDLPGERAARIGFRVVRRSLDHELAGT